MNQGSIADRQLAALQADPATAQKRLGDGFYEQKLVREQIAQLTGRRFLDGYADDETQYAALLDAGVTVARAWKLLPGVALTANQMAQLTTDMVWLVEQTVTLPDGTTTQALVPQLYVRVRPGDLDGSGALLAGRAVDLRLTGDLNNSGAIQGSDTLAVSARNIENGGVVALTARADLTLAANRDMRITAGQATQSLAKSSQSNPIAPCRQGLKTAVTEDSGPLRASLSKPIAIFCE